MAKGLTPLVGVNGSALDLELKFDWSHTKTGAIPTAAGYEVGVSVLVGQYEHTLVTCSTGGTRFNNGTRKIGPAVALGIDTRHSRAGGDKRSSFFASQRPFLSISSRIWIRR